MDIFYNTFIYAFASIFSIVNPLGMAPIFLGLSKDRTTTERHLLAYQVALYGAVLLIITLLLGPFVLRFFGISLPYIQIAGGCLVFYTAWQMFQTKPKVDYAEEKEASKNIDIAFFPLTMPITAGAGSMAITISMAIKIINQHSDYLINYTAVGISIIAVFIIVAVCYRYADTVFNKLGETGTHAITRTAAFILLAIGVEIIWGGLSVLILTLGH